MPESLERRAAYGFFSGSIEGLRHLFMRRTRYFSHRLIALLDDGVSHQVRSTNNKHYRHLTLFLLAIVLALSKASSAPSSSSSMAFGL